MLITALAGGGAEKVASNLNIYFDNEIHSNIITIVNKYSYPIKNISYTMNLKIDGPFWPFKLLFFGVIKYKKILQKYKPDISMSFLILDSIINIISNLFNTRIKTVVSVHIALSKKFRDPVIKFIMKYIIMIFYNKADMIIAVSHGVKNELISKYKINPKKIIVIYNSINVKEIQELSKKKILDPFFSNSNEPIIINIGRLTQQKGQWHLIRCFSEIRKTRKCKLIIRGNGNLKQYLEKLVLDYNLKNDVKFVEWIENPYAYLANSSLYVSTSLWEALPITLLEAMACKLPIIATKCKYGPEEILDNEKYGILIPEMDGKHYLFKDPLTPQEQVLIDKINLLINNAHLYKYYKNKSLQRSRNFDNEIILKKYETLFQTLINVSFKEA